MKSFVATETDIELVLWNLDPIHQHLTQSYGAFSGRWYIVFTVDIKEDRRDERSPATRLGIDADRRENVPVIESVFPPVDRSHVVNANEFISHHRPARQECSQLHPAIICYLLVVHISEPPRDFARQKPGKGQHTKNNS
jgi:hypothetical protein